MFGHQDDNQDDKKDDETQQNAATAPEVTPDQSADDTQDTGQSDQNQDDQATPADGTDNVSDSGGGGDDNSVQTPTDDANTGGDDNSWQHPGEPIDDSPEQISDIISPGGGHNTNPYPPMPTAPRNDLADDGDDAKVPHELIDIKQKALTQLSPLMGQLDLTPEDKFRTTMMMIQASDDQGLIKQAYDAANGIDDEKLRAQALLDIVNEINYFTQHPEPEPKD